MPGNNLRAKHASDVQRYVWSTFFSSQSFQGISIHRCMGNTQFSSVVDINNDGKATRNHSEETVVSIYVVLLVISRCICIVFSDDLSLLTLWLAHTLLQTSDQRTLSWKRRTVEVLLIGRWSTSNWKLKYFGLEVLRRVFCAVKYFWLEVEVLLKYVWKYFWKYF
jgi:hypothetical protein